MSTLNVANITDGVDTVGTEYVVNGSAKFWCFYKTVSATATIGRSFNVSSITDEGIGDTDVNLTNAFIDADIVSHINIGNGSNGDKSFIQAATTASVIECFQYDGDNSAFDSNYCAVSGHGDLA